MNIRSISSLNYARLLQEILFALVLMRPGVFLDTEQHDSRM